LDDLIDVGVVTCVVLVVLVEDLVARPDHDGGAQLHGPSTGVLLPIALEEGTHPCGNGVRAEQRRGPQRPRAHDLGGIAVLVEQDWERHILVLDERRCIALATRTDGGDLCTRCEDLVVSLADLTGPLAAGQSAKVTQEEKNLRLVLPTVTKAMLGTIRIDEHLISELGNIEWHVDFLGLPRDGRPDKTSTNRRERLRDNPLSAGWVHRAG